MKECAKCRNCYDDEVLICPVDNVPPVFTITGSTTLSGRYILESRLGQGGMGIVFRAKHKFLKQLHAIKIILPSLVEDDQNLLVRFRQEAVLAASIDHPNVIRVTDFGVENDVMPYLVMEYIDGIPLINYLVEGRPLDLKNAFDLFFPIAEGVAEAHRKGIVHRDIKPQNIMVQKNMPPQKAIKVLDFGLAKIKSADSYPSLIQAKTMNIVGSPPYMSPEQWSGEGVDHRTDIYALGAILYQMLAGRLPFQADSMPAMMYQHLTVTPPTAASLGISIPPGVEAAIFKGIAKDPKDRYDALEVMIADLEEGLGIRPSKNITGAKTEIYGGTTAGSIPKPMDTAPQLTDSQRQRFYTYFDSDQRPDLVANKRLAHEFLEAQDKIESATTMAVNADMLVKELAEAQRQAEIAQVKAMEAKKQMEADIRRQVEAEMARLAAEDREKREAEARRLADEVEARRKAEERANYLAQAALEAQKVAEQERLRRQEEAQQKELHQGSRREAEIEAEKLSQQVVDARQQYREARKEAEREAALRAEAEKHQKQIENELQSKAANEAERRKIVEAEAKKQIQEQAQRFETEAADAKKRLDEARSLIELEAQKREQAEAARIEAEQQAARLSQEIIEVQKQMQEMREHITASPDSMAMSHRSMSTTGTDLERTTQRFMGSSVEVPSMQDTGPIRSKKPIAAIAGIGAVVLFLLLGAGGIGIYMMSGPNGPANQNSNVGTVGKNEAAPPIPRKLIHLDGGSFMMGRNDIDDKKSEDWGNQFPAHSVTVGPFDIDEYETTNNQYAEFVREKNHRKPPYWTDGNPPKGQGNFPVTNVSLSDAKAYADWISQKENKSCRIPTEMEWEFAARNGSQGTTFPWGNDWKADASVLRGREVVGVGTMQDDTSAGVKDMLGNASEWTATPYALYPGHPSRLQLDKTYYVIRGLNFSTPKNRLDKPELLLTTRQYATEDQDFPFLGFRLVCTL